jgi:hypothetical protein
VLGDGLHEGFRGGVIEAGVSQKSGADDMLSAGAPKGACHQALSQGMRVMADVEDYARRLVAHRIPELSDVEIAEAFAPGMSAELGDLVLAVVDAIAERLDELEMKLDDSGYTSHPPGRDRAAA